MNLRELEVFRAVMEAGSVTAAAAELGMTQPAASKMLRQAEERLGFSLFRRDRKQMVATPEAHALLPELLGAFAALGGVRRLADALRAGRSGQLSVAAVPVLATALLPRAVQAFRLERPGVLLRLRAMTALEVVNQVADHQADLGVILGGCGDARVAAQLLCTSDIGVALPRDHPLAARASLSLVDLEGDAVITLGARQPVGQLIQAGYAEAGLPGRISIEVSQSSIACALVRSGAGVAILDGFGLEEGEAQGLVVRPLLPRIPLDVTLVVARNRLPSRLALALRQALVACATAARTSTPTAPPAARPRPAPRPRGRPGS
ncbi:LysR family transcriptional regulator [Humitalea sp. 24SJ18S-53]|uniref:LysR family transcriptional regulator n=1 Tax=Humitalea sp. 24SJ18S-53 TaxID=3422307 RepID=UPI003D6750F6